MQKHLVLGALGALSALALSQPSFAAEAPQGSNYTFNFVGQCNDCTGQANATLTVQNYVLGSALADSNLVTFTYSSNLTSFTDNRDADLNGEEPASDHLSGSIMQNAGFYNVTVEQDFVFGGLQSNYFNSDTTGSWTVSNNPTEVSDGTADVPLDNGHDGLWNPDATTVSAAPEPASWALMMLGVGFIGWALGYRKRVLVDHKAKLAAIG